MNWKTPETIAILGVLVAGVAIESAGVRGEARGSGATAAQALAERVLDSEACSLVAPAQMSQLAGRIIRESDGFADGEGITCGYSVGPGGPSVLVTRMGQWDEAKQSFAPGRAGAAQAPAWDPAARTLTTHSPGGDAISIQVDTSGGGFPHHDPEQLASAIGAIVAAHMR